MLPQPTQYIPLGILSGLNHYMIGIRPGVCLYAILTHDAEGVHRYADADTYHAWNHIVDFITEHMPAVSHGSRDAVEWWLADGHRLHAENCEMQGVAS